MVQCGPESECSLLIDIEIRVQSQYFFFAYFNTKLTEHFAQMNNGCNTRPCTSQRVMKTPKSGLKEQTVDVRVAKNKAERVETMRIKHPFLHHINE